MSKYNWEGVPEDVESIATNAQGVVIGFESHSPIKCTGGWDTNYPYYYLHNQEPFEGNWGDSLEERP